MVSVFVVLAGCFAWNKVGYDPGEDELEDIAELDDIFLPKLAVATGLRSVERTGCGDRSWRDLSERPEEDFVEETTDERVEELDEVEEIDPPSS